MSLKPRSIVVSNFSGGMNTRTPIGALSHQSFERLENCDTFRKPQTISTRRGLEILAPTSAAAGIVGGNFTDPLKAIGVYQRTITPNPATDPIWVPAYGDPASITETLIATASRSTAGTGNLRVYREPNVVFPSAIMLANFTTPASQAGPPYVQFENGPLDRLYTNVRPTEGAWYLEGLTFKRAGFPAPTVAPTVAVGAAGVLTGAYKYAITFFRGSLAAESSMGPQSATVNPAAQQVNLTAIQLVPTNDFAAGTARAVYRTLADDFSRFYLVGIINDNTTTTFTDNIPDSDIGPELGPDDNGQPPASVDFMAFHKERMFYASSATLHFSAAEGNEVGPGIATGIHGAHAEIVPADFNIPIGDTSDPIRGLTVLHDRLIIFKRNEIWQLVGNGPDDFALDLVEPRIGILAPDSIAILPDRIFFLGQEDTPRFYEFDGQRAAPISLPVDSTILTEANLNIIYERDNLSGDDIPAIARTVGGIFDFYAIWSVPKVGETLTPGNGQGIPRQRFFMFYNYLTRSWSVGTQTGQTNGLSVSAMRSSNGRYSGSELYMGASSGNMGWVYKWGRVTNDQIDAAWTADGGGNFSKGAVTSFDIKPKIIWGAFVLDALHRVKHLDRIYATLDRSATALTLTLKRKWDEETEANIPTERSESQTSPGTGQSTAAEKNLIVHKWTGRGAGYTGGSVSKSDHGWELQPILAGDKPFTLYSLAVHFLFEEEEK